MSANLHVQSQNFLRKEIESRTEKHEAIISNVTATLRQQFMVQDAPQLVDALVNGLGLSKRQAFGYVADALGIAESYVNEVYYRKSA
jgi:predicted transcriptional regulator YheO